MTKAERSRNLRYKRGALASMGYRADDFFKWRDRDG